jgi:hypothetical protein
MGQHGLQITRKLRPQSAQVNKLCGCGMTQPTNASETVVSETDETHGNNPLEIKNGINVTLNIYLMAVVQSTARFWIACNNQPNLIQETILC